MAAGLPGRLTGINVYAAAIGRGPNATHAPPHLLQTPPSTDATTVAAAVQLSAPQAMRERAQWLLWRFEKYDGDKKPRKVPYYVSGRKRKGTQGSDEDRGELASLGVAITHLARGRYDGLGFAFLPGDGLIGIDIDGAIDDDGVVSERCQRIIEACGSYTEYSPSGRGVHIICAGESETFKDNSIGLEVFCGRQYFTVTGRPWPGAPEQVAPIAEATLRRLKATVRGAKEKPGARAATPPPPGDDLAHRLEQALLSLSADMPHDDWVMVGMAIKHALGEGGFRLWDYWSSRGTKYPGSDKLSAKWASFRGGDGVPVTEATIFKLATQAGWRPPRAPKPAKAKAPKLAAAAETTSTPGSGSAADVGGGEPPDGAGGADEPPPEEEAPHWRKRLLRTAEGGVKDCRENVFTFLVHHPKLQGLLGYDEFAHRVMKLRVPPWDSELGEWSTNDDYLLGFWLAQQERLTVKAEATLVAGVGMAAYAGRFHPVNQFLHSLPPWDGIERLGHWLPECLGAEESDYTRMVGTWFVMGMVQRVRTPGSQMDYMVILEGLQGKQKSTALRVLAVRDEWFADTPVRVGTPDAVLSIAGKWLYEIAEMDSFNRAETTAVKSYVSSREDRVREPYARRFVDRKRSGVFAGSTNQSEYFKDPTGARRFWPVACDGEIDLAKLREWRSQLFAEALHRLASADAETRRYWPTRAEEEKYLVPQQERREIVDPWFERLEQWLDSKQNYGESGLEVREVECFTAFELLTKCLMVPQDRIDGGRQMATRVGIAMHKLKWDKRRDSDGGRVYRYWRPKAAMAAEPGPGVDAAGGPAGGSGGAEEALHEF